LENLERRQLVLHQGERYLALTMRQVTRIPDTPAEFPGGTTDVAAWYADQLPAGAVVG
jgi:magnesium-protoporphyrin IX monomethyl ester (oxidative) cyclase